MNRAALLLMTMSLLACGPELTEVEETTAQSQELAACYPDCENLPPGPTTTQLVVNGGFEANLSGWTTSGRVRVDAYGSGYCAYGTRCAVLGRYGSYGAGVIDAVGQSISLPSSSTKIQLSFSAYLYAFRLPTSGEQFTVQLEDSSGRVVRTFAQVNPNTFAFEGGFTGWKRFGPFDVTALKGRTLRLVAKDYRWYASDDLEWRVDGVTMTSTQ